MFTILGVIVGVMGIALPLFMLVRSMRLQSEIDELRRRIAALERIPVTPLQGSAEPAPAAPPPAHEPLRPMHGPLSPEEPPLPSPQPLPPLPVSDDDEIETLEGRIGGRFLLYAGMIVLVLGVAFFLRYAFEHSWMSPVVRIALGVLAGSLLTAFGYRLANRYRAYGLFVCGGGIALLYLSIYAAVSLYGLVPQALAFVVLVGITAGGAVLADRTQSQPLALMAVCGGFLVPFLVGGDRDAQVTLFSYDALLVAATMFLALRRDWPWLNVASLVFTGLTVTAWADSYYTPERYLRTELFLTLYVAMFVAILARTWRSRHPHAEIVRLILCAAPLAYHLASIVILADHGYAFPIYLLVLTVAAVIGGLQLGLSAVRLIAWIGVAGPLGGWIVEHNGPTWIVGATTTVAAIYVVHLAAQLRTVIATRFDVAEVVLLHANGVGVFAGLYQVLYESWTSEWLATLAIALAAVNAGLWARLRALHADAALQWAGVAFTLVAIAVAIEFDGPWAIAMWAAEGLALAWLAFRSERPWLRAGAALLFVLAIWRWLQGDIQQVYLGQTAIANPRALTALFIVALLYVAAWWQKRSGEAGAGRARYEHAGVLCAASALTAFAISKEIVAFWEVQTSAGSDAYLARELMLSGWWAAYAGLLIVVGIRRRYAPIRYFAIALFALTLGKVFLVDLELQGGIYRVIGFVAIGVILLIVSFLYQLNPSRRASSRQSPRQP